MSRRNAEYDNLIVLSMYETVSLKQAGDEDVVLNKSENEWNCKPPGEGSVSTLLSLIKLFPIKVWVKNSGTTIHVHQNWTTK